MTESQYMQYMEELLSLLVSFDIPFLQKHHAEVLGKGEAAKPSGGRGCFTLVEGNVFFPQCWNAFDKKHNFF